MAVEHIDYKESLKKGTDKLNAAIDQSNQAITTANTAKTTADVAKTSADQTRSEFDKVVAEAGSNNPEVVNARGEFPILKDRLDQVDEHLAEKSLQTDSLEIANAKDELNLINYLGNNQNIHPKVLYFSTPWNGYNYWMAYTPYPDGSTNAENPCIAVSNDLINWTIPNGLTNPLEPVPSNGYNSDTHLVYREDIATLEIWWRAVDLGTNVISIYRRTSTNGVTWTTKQLIISTTTNQLLSPAINFENGKYKIWTCNIGYVQYIESTDNTATAFSVAINLPINWGTLSAWHLDVIKTELGYEMIVCAFTQGNSNNSADLYYVRQNLDSTFTIPKIIIKRSKNITAIDYTSIYRSSILKINGTYYIVYSSISNDGARHMTLSIGTNINGLNGYSNKSSALKPNSRTIRITGGTTLTDYDVSNLDVLIINGTTPVVINSFVGAYEGKEISIIVEGTNASASLIYNSSRLLLPGLTNYKLDTSNMGMTLICSNSGTQFRGFGMTKRESTLAIAGGVTLTDYNVYGIDNIKVVGSTPLIFNSFTGGILGQKITFILEGSAASCQFNYSSKLITPSSANYTLTTAKMGLTMICTDETTQTWRVMI